jgi:hypothetical protein
VGAKVNTEALDRLALRIRGELRAHDVTFKLTRGAEPESVRVLIQVDRAGGSFDASVPPSATTRSRIHRNRPARQHHRSQRFHLSNAARQRQPDRAFSGVQAKYERLAAGEAAASAWASSSMPIRINTQPPRWQRSSDSRPLLPSLALALMVPV